VPRLVESLGLLERRAPFTFTVSEAPLSPGETDAYVLGVRDLHLVTPDPAASHVSPDDPVIVACGPPELLRPAFLAGCADYLREPWNVDELEARLDRALRLREARIVESGAGIELAGRRVRLPDGREVELSAREAVVAGLLFRNSGSVVSRRALSFALWGRMPQPQSRAVDMHVSSLRRKLGGNLIACVRGQGYVVEIETLHRVDVRGEQW